MVSYNISVKMDSAEITLCFIIFLELNWLQEASCSQDHVFILYNDGTMDFSAWSSMCPADLEATLRSEPEQTPCQLLLRKAWGMTQGQPSLNARHRI